MPTDPPPASATPDPNPGVPMIYTYDLADLPRVHTTWQVVYTDDRQTHSGPVPPTEPGADEPHVVG